MARGNIVLWGWGASRRALLPPPPPDGPRGRELRLGEAGRTKAAPPPVQPTTAALWALLPLTTAVQLHCLYQGESRDTVQEWGITQITPGRRPAEWRQPSQEGALRCVALVGCTVHEAHLVAAAAIAAHDGV